MKLYTSIKDKIGIPVSKFLHACLIFRWGAKQRRAGKEGAIKRRSGGDNVEGFARILKEGYAGRRTRAAKERKRERRSEGARGRRKARGEGHCGQKNRVPRACMCFQKGVHPRHGTAPGLSVKKKRVGREEEKERRQGETATIRERLPNGPRLL